MRTHDPVMPYLPRFCSDSMNFRLLVRSFSRDGAGDNLPRRRLRFFPDGLLDSLPVILNFLSERCHIGVSAQILLQ